MRDFVLLEPAASQRQLRRADRLGSLLKRTVPPTPRSPIPKRPQCIGAQSERRSRTQPQPGQRALDFREVPEGDVAVGAGDGQALAVRIPRR